MSKILVTSYLYFLPLFGFLKLGISQTKTNGVNSETSTIVCLISSWKSAISFSFQQEISSICVHYFVLITELLRFTSENTIFTTEGKNIKVVVLLLRP